MEHVKWGQLDKLLFHELGRKRRRRMAGQAERSVPMYRLFRKKLGDVCGPRGKSRWGDHTVEEKGGEEEWKNPASLVIVNTTVQRARKAGVSTIGSRIGGLAKMGGVAA